MMDDTGTKIDYSSYEPVPLKKTSTLVNYFIINTAQFLNAFTQVAETKLHDVDEKLDEIEQVLSLYEAKLESVPEDYFEDLPVVAMAEVEQNVVARTENPLMVEQQARTVAVAAASRGKTEKGRKTMAKGAKGRKSTAVAAKGGKGKEVAKKNSYVPPPPKDGTKITPPAGVPKVKTFPISNGACPHSMSIPGIETAAKEETPAEDGPGGQDAAPGGEPVDDGFTPEQRRKMQLEEDPNFKSYLMMKRMKIPLINIRMKIKAENKGFTEADINVSSTNKTNDFHFLVIR